MQAFDNARQLTTARHGGNFAEPRPTGVLDLARLSFTVNGVHTQTPADAQRHIKHTNTTQTHGDAQTNKHTKKHKHIQRQTQHINAQPFFFNH